MLQFVSLPLISAEVAVPLTTVHVSVMEAVDGATRWPFTVTVANNATGDPGTMEVTFVAPVADSTTAIIMAGTIAATGGALAELKAVNCGLDDVLLVLGLGVANVDAGLGNVRVDDTLDETDRVAEAVFVAKLDDPAGHE